MNEQNKYKITKTGSIILILLVLAIRIFALVLLIWGGIAVARELINYYLELPRDWYILGAYFVVLWILVDMLFSGRGGEKA